MTVRALLEAALKHFAPETKTIEKAIEKLKDDGILSSDLVAWATELRLMGNKVVHVKQTHIQREEAVELFDFAQAIIEVLYDLKPKFERLKARKAKT